MVQYGPLVLFGTVWYCTVPYGPILSHLILYGPVGTVWYGMVPCGLVWSLMVPYSPLWYRMALCGLILSSMVAYRPPCSCMVLYGTVWSSKVLHEISDNYMSQHEITHNSIRKLEKNKKALNSTIYQNCGENSKVEKTLIPGKEMK